MSFLRYPNYKDSGVEWLGEVPGHWGVGQSRRLFALRNERSLESDKQLTASQEHGVIYQEDFIRIEGRRVVEVIKGADILKHVEPNDFVISMRSFQGGIEWCNLWMHQLRLCNPSTVRAYSWPFLRLRPQKSKLHPGAPDHIKSSPRWSSSPIR